jgi:hypothetical protein
MTKYPALFSFGKEHILSALHTWLLYIGCRKFLIVSDKWMNYSMHPMKTIAVDIQQYSSIVLEDFLHITSLFSLLDFCGYVPLGYVK